MADKLKSRRQTSSRLRTKNICNCKWVRVAVMLTCFHTARAPYITQTTVFSLHTALGQILTPRFISSNHRAWSCQHGGRRVKSVTHKRHQQYLSAQLPFKQFETWRHNGVMETVERLRLTNACLFVPSWGGGEKTSHPSTLPPVVALRVREGVRKWGGSRGKSSSSPLAAAALSWARALAACPLFTSMSKQTTWAKDEYDLNVTYNRYFENEMRVDFNLYNGEAGGLKTMTSLQSWNAGWGWGDEGLTTILVEVVSMVDLYKCRWFNVLKQQGNTKQFKNTIFSPFPRWEDNKASKQTIYI